MTLPAMNEGVAKSVTTPVRYLRNAKWQTAILLLITISVAIAMQFTERSLIAALIPLSVGLGIQFKQVLAMKHDGLLKLSDDSLQAFSGRRFEKIKVARLEQIYIRRLDTRKKFAEFFIRSSQVDQALVVVPVPNEHMAKDVIAFFARHFPQQWQPEDPLVASLRTMA